MSSDGKEPGAVWQGPINSQGQVIDQATDQQQEADQQQYLSMEGEEPAQELPLDTPAPGEDEAETVARREKASGGLFGLGNPFKQSIARYTASILLPLLFFLVFSLIALPLIATRTSNPPWLFLLIFLVLAVAQSITVFYLGSANDLWLAATVISFCAFLVVSSFALAGLMSGLLLLVILVGLCLLLTRYYVHPVNEGYVDIVYAFGKYRRTLDPGLHILFPTEKIGQQLNTGETQWICPIQQVQLSPTEDVRLRASISYQLVPEDAYLAVTQINQWEESLRELLVASLQTIATTFMPEDFVAWPQGRAAQTQHPEASDGAHWDQVNAYLFQHLRDRVALWGVLVNWVRIRDVSLVPHGSAILETGPLRSVNVASEPITGPGNSKVQASSGVAASTDAEEPTQVDVPAPPTNIPSEEVLVKAYKAVQSGTITAPETIRNIAQQFAYVAQDPEKSQTFQFDAERAAANLFEQARRREEQARAHS